MMEETSLPSNAGESSCNTPPDANSPRGSQVTTLYPASRRGAMPGTRPGTLAIPVCVLGSVRPGLPKLGPSRIVGADWPDCSLDAGKKLVLIGVPSKEVTLLVNAIGALVGLSTEGTAVNGTITE